MELWVTKAEKVEFGLFCSFKPILPVFHSSNWGEAPMFSSCNIDFQPSDLRAYSKKTLHFCIPSSGHIWPLLNRKILAIVVLSL